VHVIVKPRPGWELSQLTHSWKSFTANQLQRCFGRKGAVWQDESWDRVIRDEDEFWEKVEYILNNPKKRWPEIQDYRWVGWRHPEQSTGTEAGATKLAVSPTTPKSVEQASAPVPHVVFEQNTGTEAGATKLAVSPTTPKSVEQASAPVPHVVFGIETNVSIKGGNAAQRREHDKRIGAGTMSRAGAKCPCCGTIATMEDIRLEGQAGRINAVPTAVAVDGLDGKQFRLTTKEEIDAATKAAAPIQVVYAPIPYGIPTEPTPAGGGQGAGRAFSVQGYGMMKWCDLFTPRQLLAIGTLVKASRMASEAMRCADYAGEWIEAIEAMLRIAIDRTANYLSTICIWEAVASEIKQTFLRFALPITWDFAEGNPLSEADRYFNGAVSNVGRVLSSLLPAVNGMPSPTARKASAVSQPEGRFDLIVTDPPYYDAIPYSDLMDFFYVWLRRTLAGLSAGYDEAFALPTGPKWDHSNKDGELIDDSSRHEGNVTASKTAYEDGMFRAFASCFRVLADDGRLVIVFANKQPDAWETLVSALIRAGFVVDGSWPIATEMRGGVRNFGRASLASSVWLVCKKRPISARPGWDNKVLEEMRSNIG
jgi:adenine-specific DNA methylase